MFAELPELRSNEVIRGVLQQRNLKKGCCVVQWVYCIICPVQIMRHPFLLKNNNAGG